MKLKLLEQAFSVCKLPDASGIRWESDVYFFSKTDQERSLVCESCDVPRNALVREDGWRGLRVEGVLDFSLVGVLANIASLLAEQRISIFAVSTYNTDYIFTKADVFEDAVAVLQRAGYIVIT